jgi:hypothetical protein
MKIMICGSMTFAKEMQAAQKKLQELGYMVNIPTDTDKHVEDPEFINDLSDNLKHCQEDDVIRENFKLVANADAILVLNYPKNGIDGYIGTSTLMELGIAHYFGKKLYILNDIPDYNKIRWAHEVTIMQPVILKGDLSRIA